MPMIVPGGVRLEDVLAGEYKKVEDQALKHKPTTDYDGDWRIIQLQDRGRRHENYARLCPETMKFAQRVADTVNGTVRNVAFHVLHPDTHVLSRTDEAGYRVILPLMAPSGVAASVDDEVYDFLPDNAPATAYHLADEDAPLLWEVGEAFAFDTTREHEAWNVGDQEAVLLVVDIDRQTVQ